MRAQATRGRARIDRVPGVPLASMTRFSHVDGAEQHRTSAGDWRRDLCWIGDWPGCCSLMLIGTKMRVRSFAGKGMNRCRIQP